MTEQPLDLKTAFRAIWRGRLWVLLTTALGLGLGVAYALHMPAEPTARTVVLLPAGDVYGPGNVSPFTETQIIIATSTPVLSAAGASVRPPLGVDALRGAVAAQGVSQDVLQIQVRAATATLAETLANAVATDYIAYVTKAASTTNVLLTALEKQVSALTHQFLSLQGQINTLSSHIAAEGVTSPAGQRDESILNGLRDQQQQVSLQLNNVDTQLVNAELSQAQNAGATKILQRAELVPPSNTPEVTDALAAAGAGLVGGAVLVLAGSRRDRRLRLRDAFADALGVPVVASLEAAPRKSERDWRRLLEGYDASPTQIWNVRRVLHSRLAAFEAARRGQLTVLAFAGDDAAIAASVQVAESAAALGMQVHLVVGKEPYLAPLRAACMAVQQRSGVDSEGLVLPSRGDGTEFRGVSLTVRLFAVDPAAPEVQRDTGATLLAVSSGFIGPDPLARTALAASDAHSPVEAILMVNPDPDDTTTGSLPQAGETRPIAHRAAHRPGVELSLGAPR